MSDTLLAHRTEAPASGRQRTFSWALIAVGILVALVIPLFVSTYWLQLAFTVCSLGVAMVGLTMLTGAGQLVDGGALLHGGRIADVCVLAARRRTPVKSSASGSRRCRRRHRGHRCRRHCRPDLLADGLRLSGIYLAMAGLGSGDPGRAHPQQHGSALRRLQRPPEPGLRALRHRLRSNLRPAASSSGCRSASEMALVSRRSACCRRRSSLPATSNGRVPGGPCNSWPTCRPDPA